MKTNAFTILGALDKIHTVSKDAKLNLESYVNLRNEIDYVSNYFQTSETQTLIVASAIILSCFDEINLDCINKYFDIKKHEFLLYNNELDILFDKNILLAKRCSFSSERNYHTNTIILNYIISNEKIPDELIIVNPKKDSIIQFFDDIDELIDLKEHKETSHRVFIAELKRLVDKYNRYKLVEFAFKNLDFIDMFIFFNVINDILNKGENNFCTSLQKSAEIFTDKKREAITYISKFINNETKLNTLNLVEKDEVEFSNQHEIQLTEKGVKLLYEMEEIKIEYKEVQNKKLISPQNIKKINLFYNTSEEIQLTPILRSMSNTSFTNLQKRLKNNNLPTGITALLYGDPGTGKTETVYQLAKKYNRPIFKVEISETKSMWFGESQKLVKKIFTDYYKFKKQEKVCPILLFNEADAIISKRKNAGSSAVADTENAIQNVLLEELENFDGILFATSNLVSNLDAAFERRFLFKVKFENPSQENAMKIWKAKLPFISKKEAKILANKFKFSGGEMENLARKCLMEEVVLGNKLTLDKIITFCENEKWNTNNSNVKIGF